MYLPLGHYEELTVANNGLIEFTDDANFKYFTKVFDKNGYLQWYVRNNNIQNGQYNMVQMLICNADGSSTDHLIKQYIGFNGATLGMYVKKGHKVQLLVSRVGSSALNANTVKFYY